MAKYNIYAGLGGGFGGANYQYTEEFETKEDAEREAWRCAFEEYESYEGCHGLRSWGEVQLDYCEENQLTPDTLSQEDCENIDEEYLEEVEGWLDYRAILTEEDDNENVDCD